MTVTRQVAHRPGYMPKWAWEQYIDYTERLLQPDYEFIQFALYHSPEQYLRFHERIVGDHRSEPIWRLIGERMNKGLGRFFAENPGLTDDFDNQIEMMLELAIWAYQGPTASEAMPISEKKAVAKRMVGAIQSLQGEMDSLRRLNPPRHSLPPEITSSLFRFAMRLSGAPEDDDPDYRRKFRAALRRSRPLKAAIDEDRFLRALIAAIGDWSKVKPIIGQPDAANSRRTYFVRMMADHFDHLYGSPLPNAIEGLTACLFKEPIPAKSVYKVWIRDPANPE